LPQSLPANKGKDPSPQKVSSDINRITGNLIKPNQIIYETFEEATNKKP
jgi:hypothetical protein